MDNRSHGALSSDSLWLHVFEPPRKKKCSYKVSNKAAGEQNAFWCLTLVWSGPHVHLCNVFQSPESELKTCCDSCPSTHRRKKRRGFGQHVLFCSFLFWNVYTKYEYEYKLTLVAQIHCSCNLPPGWTISCFNKSILSLLSSVIMQLFLSHRANESSM